MRLGSSDRGSPLEAYVPKPFFNTKSKTFGVFFVNKLDNYLNGLRANLDLEILCLTFGGDSLLVWSHSNDGWKKVDDCKIFENSNFLHKRLQIFGQWDKIQNTLRDKARSPS